ncbi:hypothetical protein Ahy_B07g086731 [Arachis hypogaea]|uniref:SWIM-type domain-containing protein n=1 Tax=Arachis hypogaea TaxID=3818 RepID=A0A444YAQ8_ARAHY|nr:hypothetical protein Ahy_B07g086731 [Arachis hypogaea]
MRVTHCDRQASVFLVEKLEPFNGWLQGSFRVRLTADTCDCGIFQSLHFPYRHPLASCAAASMEWGPYIHSVYMQQAVFKVMRRSFLQYQIRSFGRNGTGHSFVLILPCTGSLPADLFPPGFVMRWTKASVKRKDVVSAGKSVIPKKGVQTSRRTRFSLQSLLYLCLLWLLFL